MKIMKIREYITNLKVKVIEYFGNIKAKLNNLRGVNIGQAVDYFELGMLNECYNRLKIILKLWPNDDYAKYLMGLLYTINRDNDEALKYLESIEGFKKSYSEKLVNIIRSNKSEKLINAYQESFNLHNVENKISEI